jgi:undecaprenyl-diphosphatase
MAFYAPRHEEKTMDALLWQTGGWRELPAWRIDMEGEFEQPLTVQWAGPPAELTRFLKAKGWLQPQPLSLKNFLGMFSPDTPVEQLPVLPRLHDGRVERLRLVRAGEGDSCLVLRLWDTEIKIEGNRGFHLFAGTIEEQQGRSLAGLITMARDTGDYDQPLNLLAQSLRERFSIMQVRRTDQEPRSGQERQWSRWRGGVLLAW